MESTRVRAEFNATWQTLNHLGNRNPQIPEWKINFRPEFQLTEHLLFVPSLHYVDDVEVPLPLSPGAGSTRVDAYMRTDIALHYSPSKKLPKISFVWQNALDEAHVEANELLVRPIPAEVTRSWYVRLSHEF
jgi:hypothetical protein